MRYKCMGKICVCILVANLSIGAASAEDKCPKGVTSADIERAIAALATIPEKPLSESARADRSQTDQLGISSSTTILQAIKQKFDLDKYMLYTIDHVSYAQMQGALFQAYKSCVAYEKKEEAITTARAKFFGFDWGIGLGFTSTSRRSIESTEVIDGVVRITKDRKKTSALMLETHYFFEKGNKEQGTIGYGPFVAINVINSEDEKLGAYGVGFMMGFKRNPADTVSWNIGIGYYVDMNAKDFGSGVEEGASLPGTETSVRLKDVENDGWMLILSSSF